MSVKKMIVVIAVTALVTASLTAVAFAGAQASAKRHATNATSTQGAGAQLAEATSVADFLREQGTRMALAPVRCRTLVCINRQLTKLWRELNCMGLQNVSVYGDASGTFGYWFNNGGGTADFMTTALDFTNTGDSVDAKLLTWRCGA